MNITLNSMNCLLRINQWHSPISNSVMITMSCTCSNKFSLEKAASIWQREGRSIHMSEWGVGRHEQEQASWPLSGPDRLTTGSTSCFWGCKLQSEGKLSFPYCHICVHICKDGICFSPEHAIALRLQFFVHQKTPSNTFLSHLFHSWAALRPRRLTTRHLNAFHQNVY